MCESDPEDFGESRRRIPLRARAISVPDEFSFRGDSLPIPPLKKTLLRRRRSRKTWEQRLACRKKFESMAADNIICKISRAVRKRTRPIIGLYGTGNIHFYCSGETPGTYALTLRAFKEKTLLRKNTVILATLRVNGVTYKSFRLSCGVMGFTKGSVHAFSVRIFNEINSFGTDEVYRKKKTWFFR